MISFGSLYQSKRAGLFSGALGFFIPPPPESFVGAALEEPRTLRLTRPDARAPGQTLPRSTCSFIRGEIDAGGRVAPVADPPSERRSILITERSLKSPFRDGDTPRRPLPLPCAHQTHTRPSAPAFLLPSSRFPFTTLALAIMRKERRAKERTNGIKETATLSLRFRLIKAIPVQLIGGPSGETAFDEEKRGTSQSNGTIASCSICCGATFALFALFALLRREKPPITHSRPHERPEGDATIFSRRGVSDTMAARRIKDAALSVASPLGRRAQRARADGRGNR